MTGYFTPEEIVSQLRDNQPRGKCRHEDKRAGLLAQVQQDIARLICTASDINYFSYLIAKRGELALVIGMRGDLQNRMVTLELIRHRQRVAYFSYSDPVLSIKDLRRRECMAERKGHNALKILADEGSLTHLIAMRALLYEKLPYKGQVLTLTAG
ncbi:MAG: hypothetical protein Tsb0026_17320 [Sulfuricaulis sp.]